MGEFHRQLGPAFEALVFASVKDQSLREQLHKTFHEHPHDATSSKSDFPKQSIFATQQGGASEPGVGIDIDIPKLDLIAELPNDCIARMVSREEKQRRGDPRLILIIC